MAKLHSLPRRRIGFGPALAHRIEQHVRTRGLARGEHLSAQVMADLFGASRTPVNHALALLTMRGVLTHEPNRGYFVGNCDPDAFGQAPAEDPIEQVYQALARDRLAGRLPQQVKENELRERYGLTKAQLHRLVSRVVQEGWIERRAGYGWAFTEILTTPQALAETFRLRRVLEPASLLEPGYHLDTAVADECRRTEHDMLGGSFHTMPMDMLFSRRARFHEALVGGSRNRFFLDTIRRVNRIRRLLSYQAMVDRARYVRQAEEHLLLLDLIQGGQLEAAADALRRHLDTVQSHYLAALSDQPAAE